MSFVSENHGNGKIKFSNRIDANASDEYLQFLQQMGMDCCYTWVNEQQANYEFLARLKERTAKYGLRLFNVGSSELAKPEEVHLALPGRDEILDKFNGFLEVLGKVGVPTTTITWEPNYVFATSPEGHVIINGNPNTISKYRQTTDTFYFAPDGDYYRVTTRGGAMTRLVDMKFIDASPTSHGMIVNKDQMFDNFAYFTKNVMPVAESAKVRVCLHPNDPPADSCMGLATLISCCRDYDRAFEIANSDYLGMEFCCGCWLEGGEEHFGNIYDSICKFVKQGKVSIVHFRNVSGSIPRFTETFIDDGYANMYKIMKCFVESGYNGTMIYDHVPTMVPEAGNCASAAFAVGYMKGVLQAAETELGIRK